MATARRQHVRVHLESYGGIAIKAYKHPSDPTGVRRFEAPPNEHCRLRVEFQKDFDLKGGSAVKIVLAMGHETQALNSLDDVQCYWLDESHLPGDHVFNALTTWKGAHHARVTSSPLTLPAAEHGKECSPNLEHY